jgi:long-chain acyl-CoA synthetase
MSDSSINTHTHLEPHGLEQQAKWDDAFVVTHPWIRHYEQGVPAHIALPDHPLTWLLDHTASRYPGRTALIYYGRRLSYAQLAHHAHRFATALQRLGVNKGDRVAIALPNIPQYPIAFYGALLAGAVVVPTNPLYTEREMQHQLADAGARVLVMLDTFYPIVRAVRKQTALEHIILTNPADFLPPVLRALLPLSQQRTRSPEPPLTRKERHDDQTLHVLHTLLKPQSGDDSGIFTPLVPVQAADLAVLQYTGGTTGVSKGAMLTHRNLLANAMQTLAWIPQVREGEEVVLCVAPFFHAYGLTVGMNFAIHAAASMILVPRFKPKAVVKAIRRYHPTIFPGIPTMYLAVMQETGEPVPTGSVGELVVRGPNIMQGYWNRTEETSQTFRHGWMRTGDLGKMDEDGYFSIVERVKDVIIASGFKVYPREVEEVLFRHPAVAEVAVAGVADAYRGETVAAFVVLKPGIEASEETRRELLQYCAQELTAYKVPKRANVVRISRRN